MTARVVGLAYIGVWPGLAPIAEGKVEGDHISFTATGQLPSTTGTPTCRIEGSLSGDHLLIKLSTVRNPGGPGSGGVYEYRGGRLDASAARTACCGGLWMAPHSAGRWPPLSWPWPSLLPVIVLAGAAGIQKALIG